MSLWRIACLSTLLVVACLSGVGAAEEAGDDDVFTLQRELERRMDESVEGVRASFQSYRDEVQFGYQQRIRRIEEELDAFTSQMDQKMQQQMQAIESRYDAFIKDLKASVKPEELRAEADRVDKQLELLKNDLERLRKDAKSFLEATIEPPPATAVKAAPSKAPAAVGSAPAPAGTTESAPPAQEQPQSKKGIFGRF